MLFTKKSARRRAVRADVAEAESQTRTPRERWVQIAILGGVFFIVATFIMCWPGDPIPFNVGDKPTRDVVSPVDFTIDNEAMVKTREQVLRTQSPPVLVADYSALGPLQNQIFNLPANLRPFATFDQVSPAIKKQWQGLTADAFDHLKKIDASPDKFGVYASNVKSLMATMAQAPLVTRETQANLAAYPSGEVRITSGQNLDGDNNDNMIPKQRIILVQSTSPEARRQLTSLVAQNMPDDLVEPVTQYLLDFNQPLFKYDAALSAKLAERNVAEMPHDPETIHRGEVIASHDQEILPRDYEKLRRAQINYQAYLLKTAPWAWFLARLGQVLVVLMLTVAAALYVIFMNPNVISVRRAWALAALLLLTLFLAKALYLFYISKWAFSVYFFGTFFVLLAAIIMVVAFNQRFALGVSAVQGLLVTLALGQSLDFYLVTLSGVGIFVFGLREIRTRSKIFEVGMVATATLALSVLALGFARYIGSIYSPATITDIHGSLYHIFNDAIWAGLSGLFVACISLGILTRIERTFKVTTGSTLLELCDLNKPLLKRLAAEAPGTFNHSLLVGTLAEAAGNAIGANGLLCRVGAYYHDIGKLSKPQYFVENQSGGPNRHDKLSPAMSLLIIVGHVKDGIELAREYRLPWVVHQFIGQHHGTTLVEYFFHAARERQARELEARGVLAADAPEVSESEFRYPGPRPQTRETAIVMICDSAESLVRSMPEPTAGRIETAVHQLVMKRLMDGQFSECDLTLRDLSEIEHALLRTLGGIYHGRVPYPKPLQLSQPA